MVWEIYSAAAKVLLAHLQTKAESAAADQAVGHKETMVADDNKAAAVKAGAETAGKFDKMFA